MRWVNFSCFFTDTAGMNVKLKIITIILMVVGIAGTSAAEGFEKNIDRVSALIETGKPDSAVVILYDFMDSIENANERVRALYYFSQAMGLLGRLAEEIEYLSRAYEESSDSDFAHIVDLEYSRMLFITGNFDACIEVANKFRADNPDSPLLNDILYTEGNANIATGEFLRAFNIFNEITSQSGVPDASGAPNAFGDSEVIVESIMKEGL